MPVRRTSVEAYREIEAQGLLSPKRWEIYCILYQYGPLTANEVFRRLQGSSRINQANIATRLHEMREMGCVYEVRQRPCSVTGMEVIEWDVTDNLPTALPPRAISAKKKLEKARLAVDQLERSLQWAVQRLNRDDNPATRQWVRRSAQLLERVRGLEL